MRWYFFLLIGIVLAGIVSTFFFGGKDMLYNLIGLNNKEVILPHQYQLGEIINTSSNSQWINLKATGQEANLTFWKLSNDKKTELGWIPKSGSCVGWIDKKIYGADNLPIKDDKNKDILVKCETAKCSGQNCYHISLTEAQAVNINDYIKLGENSSVVVYQNLSKVEYEFGSQRFNITLYKNVSGTFQTQINDIFVYSNEDTLKFGANDTSLVGNETAQYKYIIESSVPMTGKDIRNIIIDDDGEGQQVLSFNDVCKNQDRKCALKYSNGGKKAEIIFTSGSLIDPTITYIATVNGTTLSRNQAVNLTIDLDSYPLKNFTFSWDADTYNLYDESLVLMFNLDNRTAVGDNATQTADVSSYGNTGNFSTYSGDCMEFWTNETCEGQTGCTSNWYTCDFSGYDETSCNDIPGEFCVWNGGTEHCDGDDYNNFDYCSGSYTANNYLWTTSGYYSGGINLDGMDDYVFSPSSTSNNVVNDQITVSAWVNPTSIQSSYSGIVMKGGYGTNAGFELLAYDDGSQTMNYPLWVIGQSVIQNTSYLMATSTWYYLTGVYNGSDMLLYANGQQIASGSKTGNIGSTSSYNLLVGYRDPVNAGANNYWAGYLDEVRIWNRSLTQAEISELYVSNLHKINSTRWYFQSNHPNLTMEQLYNYNSTACDTNNACTTSGGSMNVTFATSDCRTIDIAGYYYLTGNISTSSASCIIITADNVIVDGKGYTITGAHGSTAGTGVYSSALNTTVYNLTVEKFGNMLGVYGANSTVHDVVLKNVSNVYNNDKGFVLQSSGHNWTNVIVDDIQTYQAPNYFGHGGEMSGVTNSVFTNVQITNTYTQGIYMSGSTQGNVFNNLIVRDATHPSGGHCILMQGTVTNNVFNNATFSGCLNDFNLATSGGNPSTNNITNSRLHGSYLFSGNVAGATNNWYIYNNLINATASCYPESAGCNVQGNFNTTQQIGDRIFGQGNEIGGNYWANPTGTGFSQTCVDSDSDSFCDGSYPVFGGTQKDYLALANDLGLPLVYNIKKNQSYALVGENINYSASVYDKNNVSSAWFTHNFDMTHTSQINQLTGTSGFSFGLNAKRGQTFNANNNDYIYGACAWLQKVYAAHPNVTVYLDLYAGTTNIPIGSNITSSIVFPAGSISASGGYKCGNFTTPVKVTAGLYYALVVSAPTAQTTSTYAWGRDSNAYNQGKSSLDTGAGFGGQSNNDFNFNVSFGAFNWKNESLNVIDALYGNVSKVKQMNWGSSTQPSGRFEYQWCANDTNNNIKCSSGNIPVFEGALVDNVYPTGQIYSPVNNTNVNGIVLIDAIANDDIEVDYASIQISNASITRNITYCDLLNEPYDCSWNTVNHSGSYQVKIIPCDVGGNCNASTIEKTYIIDMDVPEVNTFSVAYETGKSSAKSGDNVTIKIQARDSQTTLSSVQGDLTSLNGTAENYTFIFESGINDAGSWSLWNATIEIGSGTGEKFMDYYIFDNATPTNNYFTSQIPVQLDNQNPNYTLRSTYPSSPYYNNTEATFSVDVEDNLNLSYYQFFNNFSGSWKNSTINFSGISETNDIAVNTSTLYKGGYAYYWIFYDDAGNSNTTSTQTINILGNINELNVSLITPVDYANLTAGSTEFIFNYTGGDAQSCTYIINSTLNETRAGGSSNYTQENANQISFSTSIGYCSNYDFTDEATCETGHPTCTWNPDPDYTCTGDNFNISTWNNPYNVNDTDFGTYGNAIDGETAYMDVNYTKPYGFSNATWETKGSEGQANRSIQESCLNYNPSKLILRVASDWMNGDITYQCYDGAWQTVYNNEMAGYNVYEEHINWQALSGLEPDTAISSNLSVGVGDYIWNVICNNSDGYDFYSDAFSLNIGAGGDTTSPYFTYIANVSIYTNDSVGIDFNATDETGFDCFSVNDTTNFAINCSGWLSNITGLSEGIYNLNITINDTSNNLNSSLIIVNVSSLPDTAFPYFTYIPNGQTLTYGNSLGVDFNATDETGFDYYVSNDSRFTINQSGWLSTGVLGVGQYYVNITINDTSNNLNSTIYNLNITQATSEVYSYINGSRADFSSLNDSGAENIYLNGTRVAGEGIINLTLNGNLINSGASPLFNISTLELGQYYLNASYDATENYTSSSEAWFINITGTACSQSLQNTTWTDWINIGCIGETGYHNESRNFTEYDANNCGFENVTYYEYRSIANESCNAPDTTPPTWTNCRNLTGYTNTSFSQNITATDDSGIGTYWLNDTDNFAVNQSGSIVNNTFISIPTLFNLNLSVNDTVGNQASCVFWINLSDYVTEVSSTNIHIFPYITNKVPYIKYHRRLKFG